MSDSISKALEELERTDPFVRRAAERYDVVTSELLGKMRADAELFFDEASKACGGTLVCDVCRRTQPCSVAQAAEYLRDGWPVCCSYVMTLAVEQAKGGGK